MDMISDARCVAQHEAARGATAKGGEFLTFRLGGDEYGIDILKVQEIRSYDAPTRIADAPPFIKGVVHLRGAIVPIVDLRIKLGCERADYTRLTVVIVLNVEGRVVGIVVDSVSDVLALEGGAIEPAPETSRAIDTRFITGIGSVSDRVLILIDIEGLMASDEIGLLDSAHRARCDQTSAACLSVCTTGRCSTSRRPHQPAASASNAPAAPPASGTQADALQLNSNT